MLLAVNPTGAMLDFGFGAASAQTQSLVGTLIAPKAIPGPALPGVDAPARGHSDR